MRLKVRLGGEVLARHVQGPLFCLQQRKKGENALQRDIMEAFSTLRLPPI